MVSSSLTLGRFMASFLVCHHVLKQAAQKATVSQRSILRLLWECRTNCTPGDDDAHEKWRTTVLNKTRSYSNLSLAPDVMLNFIQHLLDDKSNVHEMDKEFMPDLASAPTPHKAHKDTYVSTKKRQQGSVIKLSVPRRRAVTGNASKPGPDYKSLAEKRLRWIKQHKKVIREAKIEKDIFKDINSKATPQGILEWNSMYSERAQPSRRGQHPTNDGSGKQLLDLADEMDLLVKSRQTYENSLAAVQDLKLSLQQKSSEWSRRIGRAKKSLRASKSVQCREQALHIQQNRMRKQKCMLKKKSAKIKACSKDIAEREEAVTMPTCTVKERQLLDHLRGFCRDAGERHSNQMRELSYDLLSDHTQGAVKGMSMYKRNGTAKWLASLRGQDRDTIIKELSRNKAVRDKVKAGQDKNQAIAEAQKNKQAEIDKISADKAAQMEQYLALPSELAEMWSAAEFESVLENKYPASGRGWKGQRQDLVSSVYKHIHAVVTRAKNGSIKFPTRGGGTYDHHVTQMKTILGNANIMQAYRRSMSQSAAPNNNGQDEFDAASCMQAAQDAFVRSGADVFAGGQVRLHKIDQHTRKYRSSKRKRDDEKCADES